MAVQTAITFAALFLEDKHLVTFYERLENLAAHFGALYCGHTDFNITVGIEKENFLKLYCISGLHLVAKVMNIQILAFLGLELLSFDFYDSVHANLLIIKFHRWAAATRAALFSPWRSKIPRKITKNSPPHQILPQNFSSKFSNRNFPGILLILFLYFLCFPSTAYSPPTAACATR